MTKRATDRGPKAARMIYKPLDLLFSILGGALAGVVFTQLWRVVGDGEEAPKPDELDHGTREVLLAAALHGAVFGLVRAAVSRAGAKGYRRLTTSPRHR